MSTVRRGPAAPPPSPDPQRLPLRWAIIAILTTASGAIGLIVGGPVVAITAAAAVAVAAHTILE